MLDGRNQRLPLQTSYGRNLLGLSSKILCLIVNQRAAGETATQAVNNACARGGGGGDTIDIALPLPPQLTPLQSTPLQSTLRYHRRLRSAADDTATPHKHAAAAADGCCSAQRIMPGPARGLVRLKAKIKADSPYFSEFHSALC